jgi:hypothetical protein
MNFPLNLPAPRMGLRLGLLGVALGVLAACGQPKPATETTADTDADAAASAPAEAPAPAAMPRNPAPAGASVAILEPADGATVSSPVKVVLDIQGMTLAPAGDPTPDSGHHHLLVDTGLPADLGQPLPKDEQHIHLGQAQTETELNLGPGTHTLQAVLGDLNHVPHDPPVVSAPITITVQ